MLSVPTKKHITPRVAEIMLLAATFFWGWTFPVVKDAVVVMPVFAFLALRFTLAAAVMLLLARRLPLWRKWRLGGALGVVLFLSFAFQTWGLVYTSSANSAFITGLNVVWVVLLRRGGWRVWPMVCLAIVGLGLMTTPDYRQINLGDWLTLACSLFIGLHILLLARLDKEQSSIDMAFMQFASVAAMSLLVSLLFEPTLLPSKWDSKIIFALLLTALGATVFSFWVQTHYQRFTSPVRASMIFLAEPFFAAVFAVGLLGEHISGQAGLGALFILVAMILVILRQA
jgi:drug/metabolite transporter (DMT)-like permease